MTKTIFYSNENNIRKCADSFVKTGDYAGLAREITGDCILLVDNPNDNFLKSLAAEYGVRIAKASDIRDGLSRDEEALVSAHRGNGLSINEIAKATGLDLLDITFSDSVNGQGSRFEKVMRS